MAGQGISGLQALAPPKMAIGEAGQIIANSPTENQPITVTFSAPIDNAIIVLTGTNNGGNRHSYRITDVQDGNFTFIIEEWKYHDGPHAAFETINDIAIAEGTHELPDGRTICIAQGTRLCRARTSAKDARYCG